MQRRRSHLAQLLLAVLGQALLSVSAAGQNGLPTDDMTGTSALKASRLDSQSCHWMLSVLQLCTMDNQHLQDVGLPDSNNGFTQHYANGYIATKQAWLLKSRAALRHLLQTNTTNDSNNYAALVSNTTVHLSKGAVAGIVIACVVVGLVAIFGTAWVCWRGSRAGLLRQPDPSKEQTYGLPPLHAMAELAGHRISTEEPPEKKSDDAGIASSSSGSTKISVCDTYSTVSSPGTGVTALARAMAV